MSAEVAEVKAGVRSGQAFIAGRVDEVRKAGRFFAHLIVLPAPDEYTSPATVEVIADARLGEAGGTWKGWVRLGGYRRQFMATDKDTGERRQVRTADNKLYAVE
jgi:hypothetical protein